MSDEDFCELLLEARYEEETAPNIDEDTLDNFDWGFVSLTNDCDDYDEQI